LRDDARNLNDDENNGARGKLLSSAIVFRMIVRFFPLGCSYRRRHGYRTATPSNSGADHQSAWWLPVTSMSGREWRARGR
jgi:hypothetical protein